MTDLCIGHHLGNFSLWAPSSRIRRQSCRATCSPRCTPVRPVAAPAPAQGRRRPSQEWVLRASAAGALPDPEKSKAAGLDAQPQDQEQQQLQTGGGATWWWLLGGLGVLAVATAALLSSGHATAFKDAVANGPLGRSGLLASFSLIFLSEIGDKTFFIAALLAMRLGRWVSFVGSVAALGVMTVISVGIGALCCRVPDALRSSLPIGEIAGVALLVVFGVRALREGTKADTSSAADEELADAEETVQEAEKEGKVSLQPGTFASLFEVSSLIFLAEWGDRSMLATIALGAAQNPLGVAVGATAAHAAATGIAVVGGALASKHVNERTINVFSGVLFLVFAAATVYTML